MLEQIVRPFQKPSSIASRRVIIAVEDDTSTEDDPEISWGQAGDMPSGSQDNDGADLQSVGFKIECCNDDYSQNNKKTSKTRVENPDDSSQYVMVERTDAITFDKNANSCLANGFFDFKSYVESGVGLTWDVKGRKGCQHSFTLKYTN